MKRRLLIRTLPTTAIAGGVVGCLGSEDSPPATSSPDATDTPPTAPADTDAATDTGSTPTPTPTDTPAPMTAPLAGEAPTDIREHVPDRARVIREYLPGTSSASLAVGLPTADTDRTLAYCFDTVNCHLRYAWQGEFLSIPWNKDDGPAEILGETYHEVATDRALRFGDPDEPPESRAFDGYTMSERYPTFHYELDGVDVDHRIVSADGGLDLQHRFLVDGDAPAYFATGGSASYSASAGEWTDGTLQVPPEVDSFTVTLEVSRE